MPALFVSWLTMAALMTAALVHAVRKEPVIAENQRQGPKEGSPCLIRLARV